MKWYLEYVDGSSVTHTYSVTNISFKKSLSGLNNGSFTVTTDSDGNKCPINVDVALKVSDSVSQTSTVSILLGKTTKVGEVNNGLFRVNVVERSVELKNFYVEDDTDGFFVEVVDANAKISDYVYAILNTGQSSDTGWYIHSSCVGTGTIGDYTKVPVADGTWDGSEGSDDIPSQVYINANCSASLDGFLHDICGLKFWFDNENRYIYYGYFRNDTAINLTNSTIDIQQIDDVVDSYVDRIVIIGTSNTNSGSDFQGEAIKSGATQPYKSIIYQYDSVTSDEDCEIIAAQLLSEQEDVKVRYEIITNSDSDALLVEEGSKITVDSSTYIVQDITYMFDKIVLGVDSRANNFSDIISSKATIVNTAGTTIDLNQAWTGGLQNIGAPAVNEIVTVVASTDLIYPEDIDNYDNGDRVWFSNSGGALPGGLSSSTDYYVINSGTVTDTFKVSTTSGGTAVNITSDGSGFTRCRNMDSASIPAVYNIEIKDVGKIDNFSILCDFDYYQEGVQLGDEVEFLSVPTLIYNNGASSGLTYATGTFYTGAVSCTKIESGFQFGFMEINGYMGNYTNNYASMSITVTPEVDYGDGNGYVTVGNQRVINVQLTNGDNTPYSVSTLFGGSNIEETADGDVKCRWKLYTGASSSSDRLIDSTCYVSRVPRHNHSINKSFNIGGSIYPENVSIRIVNSTYTTEQEIVAYSGVVNTNKTVDLTSYLRSGANKILMYSDSPGSVNVNGSFDSF